MKTVAVIGGGIAGLCAAEAVQRRFGAKAIVLEEASVPGGKITTRRDGGFVVESGPHGFLDKEPAMQSLIGRLGLKSLPADESSAKRYIVRDGKLRLVPSSPPAFFTSGILPPAAKMRVLFEPFVAKKTDPADETVFDFAARRIGKGAAEQLVDAMVTGIYGGDPRQLSLASAFPRMRELEAEHGSLIKAQIALARKGQGSASGAPRGTLHSFAAGLGELIDALAAKTTVRTGFRAEKLSREGSGFRVEGTGGTVDADAVVVALPAYEMARLCAPLDTGGELAPALNAIPYAAVAVAVQGFEVDDFGGMTDGFGFLAPFCEGREILGAIFASTVFPDHAPKGTVMVRTLLGGMRHPEHAVGDDQEIFARVRRELVKLIGMNPSARAVQEMVFRWPKAIPQYTLGHASRVAAAEALEARVPGLALGGNALRGVAMIQCVADAERVASKLEPVLSK